MANNFGGSARRRKVKRRLCGEQNWRCAYCGQPLEYETATLDHVLPRHAYGTNAQSNLVVACLPCNQQKGGRFKMKWFAEMSEARRQIPGMTDE